MNIQEFLKQYSRGRVQIGTMNLSYVENWEKWLVYDIQEPYDSKKMTTGFDEAWKIFTSEG